MAQLGDMVVAEITVQKVSVKAASFVLELDGLKVVRMELDGHPLTDLTTLSLHVDWESAVQPILCTTVPRLQLERLLMK